MEKEVHYLGKLCKNNHEYENSGETLRFISDRSCVECKKLRQAERNRKRKEDINEAFYVGGLCINNHKFEGEDKSLRYVSNNVCLECRKISDGKSYYKRQESILEQKKEYHRNNKDTRNEKSRNYYKLNSSEMRKNSKKYYEENKEWLNKKDWERKKERISNDPILKLNRRMSSAINKTLKNRNTSKGNKSYLDLVDFTVEELAIHLEKHFTEGMSWDNYGNCEDCWHVDHIKPKKLFDYKSPNDSSFKECWSLDNFQPLWKSDNLSKGAKSMEEWIEYKNNKKETNDKNQCID